MELATLVCAYLGLRLFKRSKWLRLALIVVPLLLNALLYVVYQTTFYFVFHLYGQESLHSHCQL